MRSPSLILGLFLTFFVIFGSFAQSSYTYKEKRADHNYEMLSFHKAIRGYSKVVNKDPSNARAKLKLAESYFMNNETELAEKWYAEVIHKTHLVKSSHLLHYAQVLQSNGQFARSLRWAKKYLSANPRSEVAQNMVSSLQNIGRYFQDSSKYLVKTVNFNTQAAEFAPAYFGEGIVFSSSRTTKINLDKNYSWDKSKFLDLYHSMPLIGDQMFSQPVKLKGKVNSGLHEGPATFFQQGTRIIFTRNNKLKRNNQEVNRLNLYTAILPAESEQWTRLEALPFNSKNFSVGHPSMDRSGAILYFVSDMPGGKGGTDIYKAVYVRGKWGAPQNLGPTVNTPGNEMFPYISDDEILYFSSNGHPGLGGLDIYKVDLSAETKEVVNLGYPVNSTKDDFGFITRSNSGYFSSNRGGNDDIFQFEEQMQRIDLLVNGGEKFPFEQAAVTLKSNGYAMNTKSPDKFGNVSFDIAPVGNYELHTEAPGYETNIVKLKPDEDSEQLQVNLVSDKPMVTTGTLLTVQGVNDNKSYILTEDKLIEVKGENDSERTTWLTALTLENNIEINEEVAVNPIHYKFDQAKVSPEYIRELEKLASLMLKFHYLEFELGSHTDARGSSYYNQQLSQKRASSALDVLVQHGVASERLIARGYGESKPINSCVDNHPCNNEKHLVNRRTEFTLVYLDEQQVVSNY